MDHVASVSGSPHWGFLGSPPRSQITLGDWLHFLAESSFLSFSFFGPQEDMELSLSDFEYYGYDQNYTQFIFQSQLIYTKTNPGLVLPRYRDFGCDEGVFQEFLLGGLLASVCAQTGIHLVSHLALDKLAQVLYIKEKILNLEDLIHYLKDEGLSFRYRLNRDQLWME